MGLDVYLYYWKNFEEDRKREEEFSKKCAEIWRRVGKGKRYNQMTEEEKERAMRLCNVYKEKMGLVGLAGETPRKARIVLPSRKYPDHCFKIGYFRSSYNSGGFNSVMTELGFPTLYDIFDVSEEDGYYILPDWRTALEKTNEAIKAFKEFLNKPISKYRAIFCGSIDKVKSAGEAMQVFKEELKESDPYPYYSRRGYFCIHTPLKVCGVISGSNIIGNQGAYLIYEVEKGTYEWYLQALEIVRETIEFVLNNPKEGTYVLHWSS